MVGAKEYDVFISYRRTSAAAEARLIKTNLIQRGFRVFLDVDDLLAGQFEQALLDNITEATNFLLILSPRSLDECSDEEDYLRKEIEQAVKSRRNIVPILTPGFKFTEAVNLPAEFRNLRTYQSVNYSHELFGATVDKLVSYLQPPSTTESPPWTAARASLFQGRRGKLWLVTGIVAVIAITLTFASKWTSRKRGPEPPAGRWETLTPMPTARGGAMAASIGTMLCVVGGYDEHSDLTTFEVNDTYTTNPWQTMAPIPKADPLMSQHDLRLFGRSGLTNWPNTKIWHSGRYQGAVAVIDDNFYLFGGWRSLPAVPSSLVLIWNRKTKSWKFDEPMEILSGCSSAGVIDRKIYVLTPCDGSSGFYNRFHVYDPDASEKKWRKLSPPGNLHAGGAAGVTDGKFFYVVGGRQSKTVYSAALDMFDPKENSWKTMAAMPTPREDMAAGAINGKLYVVGGANEKGRLSVVEVYDPATNTWSTETPMPTARKGLACAVIDGKLYVVGGSNNADRIVSTVEVYSPPGPK